MGLGPISQPRRSRYRGDFGGVKALPDLEDLQPSPFRSGIRNESERRAWLLMASAPLLRQRQFTGGSSKRLGEIECGQFPDLRPVRILQEPNRPASIGPGRRKF